MNAETNKMVITSTNSPTSHDRHLECIDPRHSPGIYGCPLGATEDTDADTWTNHGKLEVARCGLYPTGFFSAPEDHDGPSRPSSLRDIRRSFAFDEWDDCQDDDVMMMDAHRDEDEERGLWKKDDEDPVQTLLRSFTSKYDIPVISIPDYSPGLYPFQTIGRAKVTPLNITSTPTTTGLSEDVTFGSSCSINRSSDVTLDLRHIITGSRCCESIPRQSTSKSTHEARKQNEIGSVHFWGNSVSVAIEGDCRHPSSAIECEWNESTNTGSPVAAADRASFHENDESSASLSVASTIPPIPEFIFIRPKDRDGQNDNGHN